MIIEKASAADQAEILATDRTDRLHLVRGVPG